MPIYAYRCAACGHSKDVLQKLSDAPLSVCPACGAAAFSKQVTAAGFQLKGSGWYVTDFRDGAKGGGTDKKAAGEDKSGGASKGADKPSETPAAKTADKPAASTPAESTSAKPSAAPSPAPSGSSD